MTRTSVLAPPTNTERRPPAVVLAAHGLVKSYSRGIWPFRHRQRVLAVGGQCS